MIHAGYTGQTATLSRNENVNTTSAFGRLDTTTSLRPIHLQCPECVSKPSESSEVKTIKKLNIRTIDKVDFLCCQECGGAWFQDRSVDEALSAAREDSWTMATPVPSAKTSAAELACPCCQGRLVAINDSQGSGAKVQRCLVCYGGWIQHSELIKSRNSSRDVLSQVGRFVRRLFK